jgi:hypothetical protein
VIAVYPNSLVRLERFLWPQVMPRARQDPSPVPRRLVKAPVAGHPLRLERVKTSPCDFRLPPSARKFVPSLWSAAACCRFQAGQLAGRGSFVYRQQAREQARAKAKRQQAAALQIASNRSARWIRSALTFT